MFNIDDTVEANIANYSILGTVADIIRDACKAETRVYFSNDGRRFGALVSKGKGNYGIEIEAPNSFAMNSEVEAVLAGQIMNWWLKKPPIKNMYDFLFDD